jgi:phosphate transport system permease protein
MTTTTAGPDLGAPPPGKAHLTGTGRLGDRVFAGLSAGSGVIVVALIAAVGVFLLAQALPALSKDHANFLTERVWEVSGTPVRFGIPDLLWVTVVSSIVAMVLAVPVAIAVALYLTQYAPARLARPFASLVDLLAAVPSIVYGLWGARLLLGPVTPVQDWTQAHFGWLPLLSSDGAVSTGTIFLASLVLAVMILPIITAISREVFAQTPTTHKEGALALGATRWEMIRTAVLPFGLPGVVSASMLGLGRALGETIAVTLILSTTSGFSVSLFSGGETFASKIANNAAEFDSPTKAGAYIAAGLVLFVLTFLVNAMARIVIERRKAFTE